MQSKGGDYKVERLINTRHNCAFTYKKKLKKQDEPTQSSPEQSSNPNFWPIESEISNAPMSF